MKRHASLGLMLAVVGFTVLVGRSLFIQRQQTALLQVQAAAARFDLRERELLRQENARLRSLEISAAELEALRADHAALPRLRAEFEALSKR